MAKANQNPEQTARDRIDDLLRQAGWAMKTLDWGAGLENFRAIAAALGKN